jgi:DNA-binding PadR family transcriptional regulator
MRIAGISVVLRQVLFRVLWLEYRMPARSRANPLALAVLVCLAERPMHVYETAGVLRERNKHASVRLNYGSLYSVVGSLERRGLIEAAQTDRAGRLPERTVYTLTAAGQAEMRDWLSELIAVPARDYTGFEAGLSFLPALPPDRVRALLETRAEQLERESAARSGSRGPLGSNEVPRVFWVEEEYRDALRTAELAYIRRLLADISNETLEGIDWWNQIHRDPG